MPATDPINPNVHPLIYRWNGILGQSQAAALEAAGKEGIIYNSTYTNFWQGAMAWSGWWHNQIGLLTEVASARVAAPIDQQRAVPAVPAPATPPAGEGRGGGRGGGSAAPLPPPTDINPRTEYPRPWMGGRWTLRDIVDYELIATMALLDTVGGSARGAAAADLRGEPRRRSRPARRAIPAAILIPVETPARSARSGASRREAADGRRRGLPRRRGVRGRRPDVRRRHLRHPDGAGVRALREGHAREADLSGGAPLADRAAGAAVRRHAPGRSACCSASSTSSSTRRSATRRRLEKLTARAGARGPRHRQRRRASSSTTAARTPRWRINSLLKEGAGDAGRSARTGPRGSA